MTDLTESTQYWLGQTRFLAPFLCKMAEFGAGNSVQTDVIQWIFGSPLSLPASHCFASTTFKIWGGLDFDCRSGGKKNAISDPKMAIFCEKMANFVQTDVRMWIFRPPLSLNNFLPFQHRQNSLGGGGGCLLVQEQKEPLVT